eukprot:CAMPEP_0184046160 /NCGR_PEP_ID=MMETSP0956-20121227/1373_1 /TAXON_ID=627963 /ORGANISM="Aplanochytrium sp, Strain PBS07" /LENGTH=47 /DNA_ID= /DNA_START= /DNA_END= /DNA_ORIENTATION=
MTLIGCSKHSDRDTGKDLGLGVKRSLMGVGISFFDAKIVSKNGVGHF